MDYTKLTAATNYFEDFTPGLVIQHARGKTVTPLDNVLITNLVMNTAEGHFNDDLMSRHPVGKVVVYGGVNFSMVLGLASQDCCENAIAELGLDNVKLMKPVFHGDTIYAYSEVLSASPSDRDDAGIVVFRHYGFNQDEDPIVKVDRKVLLKRRPAA
ncbi:MaoC family dehydratase [Novosphingobium sp. 9U]|uniref:MaoC family dehydratase n=1 Tax=Novosphingobium sp. 9U TaxID=2653158 RepID=UPI0012F3E355|nr:MaoC family dehydratase [Novosphingobium sp. 9U]VWX50590.1 Acyl dehydratase [Novosphingobium sp. 9U]